MLICRSTYLFDDIITICDRKCEKAWGWDTRPRVNPDDDYSDYLSDDELEKAPQDPGSAEGTDKKPAAPVMRHNKWCIRQCERCKRIMLKDFEMGDSIEIKDFSQRRKWDDYG